MRPDLDPLRADPSRIETLLAIVARLRDPEAGCPWDLQQDFRSILPFTLEEAYEVADAIEQGDMAGLRDELGDLLFQVVLHAQMAAEQGSFGFAEVLESIAAKMIRRHPHVFGSADLAIDLASAESVRRHWEQTKSAERAAKADAAPPGVLAGVARALPALVRAEKLQRRASRVGFDWDQVEAVAAKVREELAECEATFADPAAAEARLHEVGDLLFSCVNLARHLGVDAEQALRGANQRFERRFARVEAGLRGAGLEPSIDQREAMERLWEAAKIAEGQIDAPRLWEAAEAVEGQSDSPRDGAEASR